MKLTVVKLLEKAAEAEDKIYNKPLIARIADALERGMATYNKAEMFQMALDATESMDGKPPESASLDGLHSHRWCALFAASRMRRSQTRSLRAI